MMNKIFTNKTVKNAGWLMFGRIGQMFINLVVGLLTVRYLGPSNYGLINYAGAYTAFFMAFCTLGINSVLVKELLDNPEQEGVVLGTSLGLRGISSVLSALMILCIVAVADANSKTTIIVVALSCVGMVFHVFEIFNYWFQSRLQSKVSAIVSLVAYVFAALYKTILLITGKNVTWFAFSTSFEYIIVALLLLCCYRKYNGGKLKFSWEYSKTILSKSCHFILPSLMVAIYGQTDKIMLKHMISDAEIGYYSTAVSLCTMWCFVLTAIIDSVYPSIMKLHKESEALFIKRNKQLYAIVFYISAIVSVAFMFFAEQILIVMYGEEYLPAANSLRIITWYTAFSYLGVARNAWIVCKDKQKYLIYVYASAAISNVILNLLLIPSYGASGAAMASLIAQIITTIITPFFMKSLKENSKMMLEAILFKGIR